MLSYTEDKVQPLFLSYDKELGPIVLSSIVLLYLFCKAHNV